MHVILGDRKIAAVDLSQYPKSMHRFAFAKIDRIFLFSFHDIDSLQKSKLKLPSSDVKDVQRQREKAEGDQRAKEPNYLVGVVRNKKTELASIHDNIREQKSYAFKLAKLIGHIEDIVLWKNGNLIAVPT